MVTKKANPRKDFTQVALDVVRRATGETTAPAPSKKQESGREGGAPKKQPNTKSPD
jgi:hypothetical protein